MTAWLDTRHVLEAHTELWSTDIVNLGLAHCGCACGRFGPATEAEGHGWWLDHLTNQLTTKDKNE